MQAEHTWMLYCLGKSWRLFALLTYLLTFSTYETVVRIRVQWLVVPVVFQRYHRLNNSQVEEVQFLRQFFRKGPLYQGVNNPSLFMVEII